MGVVLLGENLARLKVSSAIALGASLSACAVNDTGFVLSRVVKADGAWVVESYSLGPHLRTTDSDPGLSIGPSRRLRVYADHDAPALVPGWSIGESPDIAARPITMMTQTAGIELRTAASAWGVTLGLDSKLVRARVPVTENIDRRVYFDSRNVSATTYRNCVDQGERKQ